ncbi:Plasmid replication protein [Streptococcus henryi]|uniref:Plasmid replication protein n=1 Tax=Streptococcus henryi TaxID=439219 RepID=A0A1G6DUZ0_9STRE|nr:replication protein [Streptococcus henryi]SDB48615.1 Plasmid replication protein [Streptococcus henryi]
MAKEKARYFTFLLYPESIPNDWELKLETLGVPMAVSPLHDKDKSNVEGQKYKKPHYHVIYIAKNPVTADSVRKKIKLLLGEKSLAMVQVVLNVENTYLYLTHESKDAIAKKKHVYDKADMKFINNFDIDRYVTLDVEEKAELFNVVVSLIRAYTLQNIFDLYDFIDENGEVYGLNINLVNEVISGKTGFMKLLFDGAYQRSKRGEGKQKLVEEKADE